MAALVQGVQYGLSSQGNLKEDTDLIFVKLTDSACRALEDFQRNKNQTSEGPTIQFLGNEGHISIPCAGAAHTHVRFNFGLSSSADIEGLQGSFECVRHQGGGARGGAAALASLGAMHCKMRVQAKEDIYEATRVRMATAEENHKKTCAREIKACGPGIGKKVKVKGGGSSAASRHLPPHHHQQQQRGRDPTAASKQPPAVSGHGGGYPPAIPRNGIVQAGNFVTSAAHTKPQGNNHAQKPGNPDVMRRPIKERLIHLLALRPYKKPELYDRIIKDGVRDRDKSNLTNILKIVAFMRDNTYHLLRHVWNEVQEEWPFYTEQEKQLLKRRKPQNLTPPGSSDCGSSGSGQSPTSTHPGSPPSTICVTGGKRPGYYDGADGFLTKRMRVSHYRKPPDVLKQEERDAPFRRTTDRDASNMNPRSREYDSAVLRNNGYPNYSGSSNSVKAANTAGMGLSYEALAEGRCAGGGGGGGNNIENEEKREGAEAGRRGAEAVLGVASGRGLAGHHDNRMSRWDSGEGGGKPQCGPAQQQTGRKSPGAEAGAGADVQRREDRPAHPEYPEYLTTYPTICTTEQRSRYKADFNADYAEYRELHAVVEQVSRRFAQLESRLLKERKESPGWQEVKDQIVSEYQRNLQDRRYQEAKQRFQHLHEKLSHIKRLVLEYDSAGPAMY